MQSPFVKDNDNFQDMQEIKSQNVSRFWVTHTKNFIFMEIDSSVCTVYGYVMWEYI